MTLLEGKAVIVTGAGAGLGRAYALACAQAGASIVANDLDMAAIEPLADEIQTLGGRAVAFEGSVSSWEDMRFMVSTCRSEFGSVDALVANAGVRHEAFPWEEEEQNLRRTVEVNILGVQFAVAHATRAMVESGRGGVILTIVSGARLGLSRMGSYGASKGAIAAATANWAADGAPAGIYVNALSPLASTEMSLADTRPDRPELPDADSVAPVVPAMLAESFRGMTGRIVRFDGRTITPYVAEHLDERFAAADLWTAEDLAQNLRAWFPAEQN